jgi:excisionase family DNA binding protein
LKRIAGSVHMSQRIEIERLGYSPAEVAQAFGLKSASTVYRWIYDGKLKVVTTLGRMRVPAAELDRVMRDDAERYNPQRDAQREQNGAKKCERELVGPPA